MAATDKPDAYSRIASSTFCSEKGCRRRISVPASCSSRSTLALLRPYFKVSWVVGIPAP